MPAALVIALWLAVLYGLGWVGAGFVSLLVPRLPDRGLGAGRCLALLAWAWGYWFVPSLTPLPATPAWAMAGLAVLLVAAGRLWKRGGEGRPPRSAIVADALIFWVPALLFLFLRGCMGDISGSEQVPDFMIFRSLLEARHFPPEDVWFAGAPLNYYYLSQLLFVPLAKICSLPPEVAFNLALAAVLPLCGSALATVAMQTAVWPWRALGFVTLALFLGNLATAAQLLGTAAPFDYYQVSRVIPDTINEFPLFSFFVGDLHAHFVSLPFSLTAAWLTWRWVQGASHSRLLAAVCGALIALHGGLNTWAIPPLLLLTGVFWSWAVWSAGDRRALLKRAAAEGLIWLIVGAAASAPYFYHQHSPALTINWTGVSLRSDPAAFFLHWGPLLLPLALLAWEEGKRFSWRTRLAVLAAAAGLAWWQGAVLAGLLLLLLAGLSRQRRDLQDGRLGLALAAVLLLCFCELFYFSEGYAFHLPYPRINTVFKFHYLAWGFLLLLLPSLWQALTWRPRLLCAALWLAGAIYFPLALVSRPQTGFWSLDGLLWFKIEEPARWQAVAWLQRHTAPGTRMVEAVAMSQPGYNLISAFSGRPTLVGWLGHEGLWRGGRHLPQLIQRNRDAAEIYQTRDQPRLQELLRAYRISYVVFDDRVRLRYGVVAPRALASLPVAFRAGELILFRAGPK